MFTNSSRYTKLSEQVAQAIENDVRRGGLRDTLPGERYLAESMQVSRRTIREAMGILREKKLVQTVHGLGTKVIGRPSKTSKVAETRSVGLLLPETVDQLRPHTAAFIDSLRALFYAEGIRLDTHVSHRFYSGHPSSALGKLVRQFSHEGWILAFSTRDNQLWFQNERLPVVVVGTTHEGVRLPSTDIDLRATCRHAATLLLRRGHRRIAMVIEKSGRAGDSQSEMGFLEGAEKSGHAAAEPRILRHGGTASSIRRLLVRMMKETRPPSALLVANPYHYLAVASVLAEMGVKVPRDLSLLCRDDDVFLPFLATEPSRYVCSAMTRAKAIYSTIMRVMAHGGDGEKLQTRILPEFTEGESIREWTV